MNSTSTPFTAKRHFIEEQLLRITIRLKNIDNTTNDDFLAIYQELQQAFQSIEKCYVELKFIVLTALIEYEPGVVYAFADNHLLHEMLGLKIVEIAEGVLLSESRLEKATGIASLIYHFNKYYMAIHENMYLEEATLLPLLKRYYNDDELLNIRM
ncbi:MAG TPA: hypothetical protein VD794_07115, partial [Flavisolibacter sp.]|nr:hypothetical protein [Flavisolibacter sp.]